MTMVINLVTSSVRQGTVLGQLLFNVYISNEEPDFKSLQDSVENIPNWCMRNRLFLNVSKYGYKRIHEEIARYIQ